MARFLLLYKIMGVVIVTIIEEIISLWAWNEFSSNRSHNVQNNTRVCPYEMAIWVRLYGWDDRWKGGGVQQEGSVVVHPAADIWLCLKSSKLKISTGLEWGPRTKKWDGGEWRWVLIGLEPQASLKICGTHNTKTSSKGQCPDSFGHVQEKHKTQSHFFLWRGGTQFHLLWC